MAFEVFPVQKVVRNTRHASISLPNIVFYGRKVRQIEEYCISTVDEHFWTD